MYTACTCGKLEYLKTEIKAILLPLRPDGLVGPSGFLNYLPIRAPFLPQISISATVNLQFLYQNISDHNWLQYLSSSASVFISLVP